MRIVKNPMIDQWELAESEGSTRPLPKGTLTPCTSRRILIADDEAQVRSIVHRMLDNEYAAMVTYDFATNGEEAVAAFSAYHHTIILMDLSMPHMDGETAAMQILDVSAEWNWVPPAIIFLTGLDPAANVRNIVACDPAHCLLRKPVTNRILLTAVNKRLQ